MIDTARRLEEVRQQMGFPSLRSFHARLAEGWTKEDGRVSYEAARNYHFDREAPVSYMARVADVFGVRVEWLVSGEGGMTDEGQRAADILARGRTHSRLSLATGGAADPLMLELLRKLIAAQPEGVPELSDFDLETAAKAIEVHLLVTSTAFAQSAGAGAGEPAGQFFILSLMAMLAMVPGPQQGRPIREVLKKLPQRGPRSELELSEGGSTNG